MANIFLHIILAYVLGAQKDRLVETVFENPQRRCFCLEVRKLIICYALLTKGLLAPF